MQRAARLAQRVCCGLLVFGLHPAAAGARAPAHLFVAVSGSNTLLRFPLDRHGFVKAVPDGAVTTTSSPEGVAIGPQGEAFVSAVSAKQIEVFAPNFKTGSQPERVVDTPSYPTWIAVDSLGYLDVTIDDNGVFSLLQYPPGAGGSASPDLIVALPKFTQVDQMAVSSDRRIFLQTLHDNEIIVEVGLPQIPLSYTVVPHQQLKLFTNGITTDGAELYVSEETAFRGSGSILTVDALPLYARGVVTIDRAISAADCYASGSGNPTSYGIAAHGTLLYVECALGAPLSGNSLQVYDAMQNGLQSPLFVLQGSELKGILGIALGP